VLGRYGAALLLGGASHVRTDLLAGGWFALPIGTDTSVGDVIVSAGSATHRATASRKSSCSYQVSPVQGANDQLNLLFKQVAKSEIAQPVTGIAGPCFHTSLMRNAS
jgi:hypothetical protein